MFLKIEEKYFEKFLETDNNINCFYFSMLRYFLLGFFVLILIPFTNSYALQQTANLMEYKLDPGNTQTIHWGFVSDIDEPSILELSAEGVGSELLEFPKTVELGAHRLLYVNFTVNVPDDYQTDIELTPSLFALQKGQDEGQTQINIRMQKVISIKIGNPPEKSPPVESTPDSEPSSDSVSSIPESASVTSESPGGLVVQDDQTNLAADPEPVDDIQVQQISTNSEKKSGCLIATASFDSELAPQVQLLREIRDNVLFDTKSGTSFMAGFNEFYYSFSPTVSDWERQSPEFKELVKTAITPMLSTLSILNYVNVDSESEMLGYGIGIILLNAGMYLVLPALVIVKVRKYLKAD